jgi:peptide/nickel transport system ATP-binding protein
MSRILEVQGLRTEFHLRHANVAAVDDISFHVDEGECLGMVGESGCGKTTTGLSIMQLLPNVGHVVGGSIQLRGRELVGLSEREMSAVRGNDIGMIFQDPLTSLNPTMTIGKQIAEAVRLHNAVSKEGARNRALEVLELVEMPRPAERMRAYPHQLSGGLRQRVMIAMALACNPTLLIADEPTTALDVTIQSQILDLLDRLRSELRMSVILITHDMGVIAGRSDRVVVMYAGTIIEEANTDELFGRTRHPYTEALLSSVPTLEQDRSVRLTNIPGLPPDLSQPIDACRFAPRCRYAQADCRAAEPPLLEAADSAPDHLAACYHQVGSDPDTVRLQLQAVADTERRTARDDEGVSPSASPVVLRVNRLVKEFPVTSGVIIQRRLGSVKAVSDVSFDVGASETFGLVGESGCGKTTVGRLIVALEQATSGTIEFEGEDLAKVRGSRLRRVRRDVQLMFQDPYASLDPRMRVGTILKEPLTAQGIGSAHERTTRARDLLGEVGLSTRSEDLYPHEFSGGQRQRIGLARALILDPRLIVADEPVSALDVSIQAQILNLMRDLQERRGLSYVFISHDLAVVKYVSDTIGVMYLGKLVEVAPAARVYTHAAHPYTQALVDTIPAPDVARARATRGTHIRGELPSAIDPPSGCRFRTRCPRAQERCALEEPPMRPFGLRHFAACHFPLQEPIPEAGPPAAAGRSAPLQPNL